MISFADILGREELDAHNRPHAMNRHLQTRDEELRDQWLADQCGNNSEEDDREGGDEE